jgi:hypothetical protein
MRATAFSTFTTESAQTLNKYVQSSKAGRAVVDGLFGNLRRKAERFSLVPRTGAEFIGSQNSVTILLPFLAYFGATGDESRRKRTKVPVAQVKEKARSSSVLLLF